LTKLKTLTDILDTILDEAMAREIVDGEYEPKWSGLMSLLYLPLFGGDLAGDSL
jgi:hypothetical protein